MRTFKSRDGSLTFEEREPSYCWLARDADDLRAGHQSIVIEHGDEVTAYEVCDWKPTKLVDHVLAVCGFKGGTRSPVTVAEVPEGSPLVRLKGFAVPEGKAGELMMMLHRDLTGDLGGFHPVVMGQVGFHRAPWLFSYLWHKMGAPPILVRHPDHVHGLSAGHDGPMRISQSADLSATIRALRTLDPSDPG